MNSLIHGFKDIDEGEVSIEAFVQDERLWIKYQDNGNGMKEEDLKRIFDPFFTTNREHGGSGLGMNIVHNIIVGQMSGNIDVESNPGFGIKITMDVPLA